MASTLRNIIVCGVWLIISVTGSAQQHYLLDSFKAIKDKNRVILLWTMKQGSTCIGTGIFRSTNGIDYENIGEVNEVCGALEKPVTYQFIDENPVKGATNYYVLELGFSGKTNPPVKASFRDFNGKTSMVVNNPGGSVTIYFDNPDQAQYTIRIFSLEGNPVQTVLTREEEFSIEPEIFTLRPLRASFLPASVYIYSVTTEAGNTVATGKFFVTGS